MALERLQKVLARTGIASRRAAEELITKGRVRVDGKLVTQLGERVDARRARVEVDGKQLLSEALVYVVLHKPRAVMCTLADPEGRETVADLLRGTGARVAPVGRLDYHTSGVLLCTNDGEFSNVLQHPKNKAPKVYVAKVRGVVGEEALERWSRSIEIDGRATRPAQVRMLRLEGDKTWLEITLREGRNRQVRRLGEVTGFPVMRLARVAYAGITAEDLRPGQWRHLTPDELTLLKREFGVPRRVHNPPPPDAGSGKVPRAPRPRTGTKLRPPSKARAPSEERTPSRGRPAPEPRTPARGRPARESHTPARGRPPTDARPASRGRPPTKAGVVRGSVRRRGTSR